MQADALDRLRYPIGRFERPLAPLDPSTRTTFINMIEIAPAAFRRLAAGLTDSQLETPYRPGGWTVRQVLHHVPDSHMNAYVRMKLAATEDMPAVRAYDEARWAELPEARTAPVAISLDLLDGLHRRWVLFLRALSDQEFRRVYRHSELGLVSIDEAVALYAWHGRHHAAHIEQALAVGK